MFTQEEITEYVELMQRDEEDAAHWHRLRELQLDPSRVSWTLVAEWYREYEEETGTMLGCD